MMHSLSVPLSPVDPSTTTRTVVAVRMPDVDNSGLVRLADGTVWSVLSEVTRSRGWVTFEVTYGDGRISLSETPLEYPALGLEIDSVYYPFELDRHPITSIDISNHCVRATTDIEAPEMGLTLRFILTQYADGQREVDMILQNGMALSTTLRDTRVGVFVDTELVGRGIIPPFYAKVIRMGDYPMGFVAAGDRVVSSTMPGGGCGPLELPATENFEVLDDQPEQGGEFGWWRPDGYAYGGVTSGSDVDQLPELCAPGGDDYSRLIQSLDRQPLALAVDSDTINDLPRSWRTYNHVFERSGPFMFALSQTILDDDPRHFDPIDMQHYSRVLQNVLPLAMRHGDPVARWAGVQAGYWNLLTFWHEEGFTASRMPRTPAFGRAEGWAAKAISSAYLLAPEQWLFAEWLQTFSGAVETAQSSVACGLVMAVSGGQKIAQALPYDSNYWAGRSNENIFIVMALLAAHGSGATVNLEVPRRILEGLRNMAMLYPDSTTMVDRYACGLASGAPDWVQPGVNYHEMFHPEFENSELYRDSFQTGNTPAYAYICGDVWLALDLLFRATGETTVPEAFGEVLSWGHRAPERLARTPFANYGATREICKYLMSPPA